MIFSPPAASATSSDPFATDHPLLFARRVGRFAFVQVLVQLIGFASGILLIRRMEQHEYALFTIANTMQGTLNVLADIGISIGMISIGGRVWQDGHRFGELINTGLKLRRKLGAVSILGVTPLLYYMLVKNGAPVVYAMLLIAAILGGLFVQLSLGVLDVVPRLRSDIALIQKIDFTGSLARLIVLIGLTLVFLNAGLAVLVGSSTLLLQYLLLRHYVAGVVDLEAKENPEDRKAMLGFIRNQAANALFFCFQGQITIFLITIFGHRAGAIAEVGALGRLAMIFTLVGNLISNIFAPAFARCQEPRRLRWLYAAIVGAVAAFGLLVLLGAALLPNQFLFILGDKYAHLQHELLLIVGGAVVGILAATLWTLNASRAWIVGSWLYVPLTIGTQLVLIPFTDFSSVSGVLIFNLISLCPSLLLNIGLSYRGFHRTLAAGQNAPERVSSRALESGRSTTKPLRILVIVNLPWDARLGASRVWIELAREWTSAGHTVEKFCLTDAYPRPARSRAGSALRLVLFPARARDYVRRNANRFDVIDCLIGMLPFEKSSLGFRGLLVARSVGLYRLYDQFNRQARILWPNQTQGRWFGRLFHRFLEWRVWVDSERSVRHCDLLNVPSEDERLELGRDPAPRARAIVQPYGLTEEFRASLARAAAPPLQRQRNKTVCFLGMWSPRKGAYDWPSIITALRQHHPEARFLFLGTMFEESVVRADLGSTDGISCRTTFAEAELPALLANCTIGLFPSYIEGFGFAVLEQLAAGLPTVAYDVPGPRQILQKQCDRLLTPVGEPEALAARAAELLSLSAPDYEKLSAACVAMAQSYRWPEIARETIEEYRAALESLGQPNPTL